MGSRCVHYAPLELNCVCVSVSKASTQSSEEEVSSAGFLAVEDEPLIIDKSSGYS